jgi:hypothetical protein
MSEETVETVEAIGGVIEVTAKKGEREATISYDFGTDLAEMTDKFGADIVFTNARSNMKISLQGLMRRRLEAGESCEALTSWKPGQIAERVVDPVATAKKALAGMSDEEREAFIARILAD